MAEPHKWMYYKLELPGRQNVREPIPPPTLTIIATERGGE
jgi:hypothetical protein